MREVNFNGRKRKSGAMGFYGALVCLVALLGLKPLSAQEGETPAPGKSRRPTTPGL